MEKLKKLASQVLQILSVTALIMTLRPLYDTFYNEYKNNIGYASYDDIKIIGDIENTYPLSLILLIASSKDGPERTFYFENNCDDVNDT
jgi:hypothetical protein